MPIIVSQFEKVKLRIEIFLFRTERKISLAFYIGGFKIALNVTRSLKSETHSTFQQGEHHEVGTEHPAITRNQSTLNETFNAILFDNNERHRPPGLARGSLKRIPMKIPNDILNILDSCTVNGNVVRITSGQLDRKTYESVNKVLLDLGGKWNRLAKGHLFTGDPSEVLESAILTGEYCNKKQDFGFFETPPELARRVHELADLHAGHLILEPSAGRGALLDPFPKDTFEIRTAEILPENITILQSKGYLPTGIDFLETRPDLFTFDRVIMNPPFAKQADIDHVTHALEFLKPDGRLVAIMSAGIKFRQNKKTTEFMAKIKPNMELIEDNPDGAFKASGTMVNTVTVVIQL